MNPDYLWLVDGLQLLTIFVVGPVIASVIAYSAWRRQPQNLNAQMVRQTVRRVWCGRLSPMGVGEVDQR